MHSGGEGDDISHPSPGKFLKYDSRFNEYEVIEIERVEYLGF
jgi:hypothetical protein